MDALCASWNFRAGVQLVVLNESRCATLCRDSHGDMSAPVSRTSSLQHARRSLHDGRNGDSSLEHTPPRVMRSVSAPGSGVKDDASTRSISSDTVRRVSHCCSAPGASSAQTWLRNAVSFTPVEVFII